MSGEDGRSVVLRIVPRSQGGVPSCAWIPFYTCQTRTVTLEQDEPNDLKKDRNSTSLNVELLPLLPNVQPTGLFAGMGL
jgi:hypothetical protein